MYKRVVGLWVLLCVSSLCAVEVTSGTMKVVLSDWHKGRVSNCIIDAREYVSQTAFQPLFKFDCCAAGKFKDVKSVKSFQAQSYKAEKIDGGYKLIYKDVAGILDEVVCTVVASGDDIKWRISWTPKKGWAVIEAEYPVLALADSLGSVPFDDAIVMGNCKGGLIHDPMNPERVYYDGIRRRHRKYPGNLAAQFGCFYDSHGGFYTAAYDNNGYLKTLLIDRLWRQPLKDGTFKDHELMCRWTLREYTEESCAQPYDIVTRGFKAHDGKETDWRDAADIYKAWAEKQFWCKTPFLARKDIPAWGKNAPAIMRFNREWFKRPEFLKDWLENYWMKKFPGVPLIAILEGWEKHGDWITDYFPCYPDDEKFKEMMGWIKGAGGHPWPWPGGHHWNVTAGKQKDGTYKHDFSKDFYERAAPYAMKGKDGKILFRDLVWLGGGYSAVMCPSFDWTINWWNKDVACELVKRGADLVQADQDNGGMPQGECWAEDHGHKPGWGVWMTKAMRHQFSTMRDEMRKLNPRALISFEEPNEYYNDMLAFVDYRNCRDASMEWASVFRYIYGEYVCFFQSGYEQHTKPFWLAFCAADGQIPRLPMSPDAYLPRKEPLVKPALATTEKDVVCKDYESLDFCERWIRFYHGEGRRYLAHGKQLHPPKMECKRIRFTENFRGDKFKRDVPCVFHNMYEAADGSRAVVFVNATPQEQPVAWRRANGLWEKFTLEPKGLKLVLIK